MDFLNLPLPGEDVSKEDYNCNDELQKYRNRSHCPNCTKKPLKIKRGEKIFLFILYLLFPFMSKHPAQKSGLSKGIIPAIVIYIGIFSIGNVNFQRF